MMQVAVRPPSRPSSRAKVVQEMPSPRPASRASASSSYYETGSDHFELSRSPSLSSEASFGKPRRLVVQEKPPATVSMVRRPSIEDRKRSRAEAMPPRPASRASTNSSYYETGIRNFSLRRSPSLSSTSTLNSEVHPLNKPTTAANLKGKCPHCHIHSWLPHSPHCPRKK